MSLKDYVYLSEDKKTWIKLPDPDSYQLQPLNIEDILTAASGKTIKVLQRTGKMQISCSFTLTDIWLAKLAVWNAKPSMYVKYFDDIKGEDAVMQAYTQNWNPQLIENSQNHAQYKGIWTCPIDFIEF